MKWLSSNWTDILSFLEKSIQLRGGNILKAHAPAVHFPCLNNQSSFLRNIDVSYIQENLNSRLPELHVFKRNHFPRTRRKSIAIVGK